MQSQMLVDTGSFRDPANKVYILPSPSGEKSRVFRGLRSDALEEYENILKTKFWEEGQKEQSIISTTRLNEKDKSFSEIAKHGNWDAVLEHTPIPFISYPYEWSFSMLKAAALLQLDLVEKALEEGWTLKDATPYNIQWQGAKPVFIDTVSFERGQEGDAWVGYRQFCMLFLIPLMLRSYLGFDPRSLLRSQLEGVEVSQAASFFRGFKRLHRGVISHILLPSYVEGRIKKKESDDKKAQKRFDMKRTKAMNLGLVQGMNRLVQRLSLPGGQSDWSEYACTHTYDQENFKRKMTFVEKAVSSKKRHLVWDLGCNTGSFSKLCSKYSDYVIAVDSDEPSVDSLYNELSKSGEYSNILPLVSDLANMSPGNGWNGKERRRLEERGKPDIILCLALIHHVRLSSNIPLELFFDWLASLEAEVVIEFVDRNDEMVEKLLMNKKEQYPDYTRENFESALGAHFKILSTEPLKGEKRRLYHIKPK